MSVAGAAALILYVGLRASALGQAAVPSRVDLLAVARALPTLYFRAAQAALVPLDRAPTTVAVWAQGLGLGERLLYAGGCAGLVALGVLAWARGRRVVVLGLLWWLAALAPLGLVVTSPWPGLSRWLYAGLPGLGLALHAGLISRLSATARRIAAGAIVAVLLVLTELAIPVWRDGRSLWTQAIAQAPHDPFPYQALGRVVMREGDVARATALFEQAYERGSRGVGMLSFLALGRAHLDRCQDAAALYERLAEEVVPAAQFYEVLGRCWRRAGETGRAADSFSRCAARSERCRLLLERLGASAPSAPP